MNTATAKPAKSTYTVTLPDGVVVPFASTRTLTHAVICRHYSTGEWMVWQSSSSEAAATKAAKSATSQGWPSVSVAPFTAA